MYRVGTSHFKSKIFAVRYYYYQECHDSLVEARQSVDRKIAEKSIHIGPPTLKGTEQLMIDEDGRYHVVVSQK